VRDRELMAVARAEAFRHVEEGPRAELDEFLEKGGWQRRFGLARVG
jgi:hypothetical protein